MKKIILLMGFILVFLCGCDEKENANTKKATEEDIVEEDVIEESDDENYFEFLRVETDVKEKTHYTDRWYVVTDVYIYMYNHSKKYRSQEFWLYFYIKAPNSDTENEKNVKLTISSLAQKECKVKFTMSGGVEFSRFDKIIFI